MMETRFFSAAAHHRDLGFLVSGGNLDNNGWPKTSTEITKDGITFEAFTPLPTGFTSHCLVALDGGSDGDFFVAGGWDGSNYVKRALIHRGNQWVEMREMPTDGRASK